MVCIGRASLLAQQQRICLQGRRLRRHRFDPWVSKIPWRTAWQPTPVFLSGESHGQRSLEGYSPCGCKESDTTKATLYAQAGYRAYLKSERRIVAWNRGF